MTLVKTAVSAITITMLAASSFAGHGRMFGRQKNVIMMIPDGCSASIQTLARLVKGEELALDKLDRGAVKTSMANSVITGSAAAATAFASGHKTTVRFLGVGPREDDLLTGFEPTAEPYEPVASVLEAARLKGMSVGVVSTSRITHATPAAYYSHVQDRGMDNEIIEHLVYQGVDVVFGGGFRHLLPKGETYTTTFGDTWGGKRTDGENLYEELLSRGVRFVDNKDDMAAVTRGPVWGLFDDSHMDPDMDRDDFHPTQPSLAEMTAKAIEILSQNPRGFFLMVEGSQVDWAGHANDAAYMTYDFLAFDDAVAVAVDFAETDRRTSVIAFPDHNTGALSLGHQQGPGAPAYTGTTLENMIDPIKEAKVSVAGLLSMVPDGATAQDFIDLAVEYWGSYWSNMTLDQAQTILDMGGDSYAASQYISSELTAYGWTTHGHTGEDVPVWTYGCRDPQMVDNTDLAKVAAKELRVSLKLANKWLFVDVQDVFDNTVLESADEGAIMKIGDNVVLHEGKDYLTIDGVKQSISGLSVYAPELETFFVPRDAIFKIRRSSIPRWR